MGAADTADTVDADAAYTKHVAMATGAIGAGTTGGAGRRLSKNARVRFLKCSRRIEEQIKKVRRTNTCTEGVLLRKSCSREDFPRQPNESKNSGCGAHGEYCLRHSVRVR